MTHSLRVAVLCGFSEPEYINEQEDEILFAYRVLRLVDSETLDAYGTNGNLEVIKKQFREASKYESPLFGKFNVFGLPPEGKTFAQHLLDELSDDTFSYAIVIMPRRHCGFGEGTRCDRSRTTPYVPMEYALAEGVGKCPIAVIEDGVPESEAPLAHRCLKAGISRDSIRHSDKWLKIHQRLKQLEEQAIAHSRMHFGLKAPIEDFYLRFCRYILTARQVQIFNHSLLPLGGNYDQNDTGYDARLVQEPLCARDLYFELEEALLSESDARIKRLLEAADKREWRDLKEAILQRIAEFSQNNQKAFALQRVVSVPDAALFGQEAVPQDVLRRYASLFRQIGRIEKRQVETTNLHREAQLHIHYALAAFQTRTLHSFPTTVHITHENNARSCIWGFLRSCWGEKAKEDHFFVARNGSIVDVLEQHVGMFFDGETIYHSPHVRNEPLKYLLQKEGWDSNSVQVACAELAELIHQDEVCVTIAKELQLKFCDPAPGFSAWLRLAAAGKPTARS